MLCTSSPPSVAEQSAIIEAKEAVVNPFCSSITMPVAARYSGAMAAYRDVGLTRGAMITLYGSYDKARL